MLNKGLTVVGARFSKVEDRLEKIEGTLSGLADGLLRKPSSKSSPSSLLDKVDDGRTVQESQASVTNDSQDPEKTKLFHGHVLKDVSGYERYFRSSSSASLMWEAYCIINARNTPARSPARSQALSEASRQLFDCFNDNVINDRLELSHDGLPLVLPPKFILDSTVGPFFSQVHGLMPIFNKKGFEASVKMIYAGKPTGSDRAWTMCFNNIVLLTLMPKITQGQEQHSHMDVGLVKAFTDNFRRGFQHLDEFLRPTLCNVQVLITMVLVAQENLQSSTSAFLISQACSLARSMGLHKQRLGMPGLDLDQQEERRNVFWSLYILDTTTSFTREKPMYLPLADCDIDLPPSNNPTGSNDMTFLAKICLAQVQQNVYQSLYSAEAARWSPSKRHTQFLKLSADLERLEAIYMGESTNGLGRDELTHFWKELEFAFSTTRILIYRSRRESFHDQRALEEAVKCLRIISSLRDEKINFGAYSVLLRMFENYPFVAFFHLFYHVMNEVPASEEIQLLNEVTTGLRGLQTQKAPLVRLCSPLPIACALMDTISKAKIQNDIEDQELFNDFSDSGGFSASPQTSGAFSNLTEDSIQSIFGDGSSSITPQVLGIAQPLDPWFPMDTSNFM